MNILICAIGVLLVIATFLPILPVGWWWVRVTEYPRLQIAVGLLTVIACLLLFFRPLELFPLIVAIAAGAALLWQASWIWPFTPMAGKQVLAAETCDNSVRFFVFNVRVGTRDAEPALSLIAQHKPDIVLLVETDAWWDEAVKPLAEQFETSLGRAQENGYGMHFYTNMPVEEAELRYLVEPEIPSVHARLRLPDGTPFLFLGLHPQPPVPNFKNTLPRDAELLLAGQQTKEAGMPFIVAGDMNDVAWSKTTSVLLRTSNLLDPRRGRGIFSTFPVQAPGLRWPLDHIFHTDEFKLVSLSILGDSGSDHFPLLVQLCHEPAAEAQQDSPPAQNGDHEKMQETVENGKDEAQSRDGAEREKPV